MSRLIPAFSPLSIVTQYLPSAAPNEDYSFELTATGGLTPYLWSLVGGNLPDGLELDGQGIIQGAAAIPGTYYFRLRVQDSSDPTRTAEQDLSLVIMADSDPA